MGSSVSSSHNINDSKSPSKASPTMQKSITQQVIPTSGTQPPLPSSFTSRPLKGILKNKCVQQQKIEKPVKIVELYVLRGNEWNVTRVREVNYHILNWNNLLKKISFRTRLNPAKRNSNLTRLWSEFTRSPHTIRRFWTSSPSDSFSTPNLTRISEPVQNCQPTPSFQ